MTQSVHLRALYGVRIVKMLPLRRYLMVRKTTAGDSI